jgi:hypothetical protein
MMGRHARSESLFYYFRLDDQVPESHLLLKLLAYCAGRTVNEVQAKQERPDCDRITHSNDTLMNDPQRSDACFLGAGYSLPARVRLAKDLLRAKQVLALSQRSETRFFVLREHYENWQRQYPSRHSGIFRRSICKNTKRCFRPGAGPSNTF